MEKDNSEIRETVGADFNFKEPLTIQKVREQYYKVFSHYGYQRSYDKGSTVFQFNDTADEAYFVETGRIRTYNLTQEGREVTFEMVNPGESLGFVEVFMNSPRMRTAETICNKTTLWVMNKDQLFDVIFSNKKLCFVLTWALAHYVLRYQGLVEELAILPIQGRVIQLLLRMAKERGTQVGDCIIIDLPITHDEIAKMVGSSRTSVTLILNDLREQGILSWEQKKIKILHSKDINNTSLLFY